MGGRTASAAQNKSGQIHRQTMRMLIYALVPGETKEDALGHGQYVFDQLTGVRPGFWPVYDYYVTFDEDGMDVAGADRWGDLPTAVPAQSEQATEWLEAAVESANDGFSDALNTVTDAVDSDSAQDLFTDRQFKRACRKLGRNRGFPHRVYDQDTTGLITMNRINNIREPDPQADADFWVVPADVHI